MYNLAWTRMALTHPGLTGNLSLECVGANTVSYSRDGDHSLPRYRLVRLLTSQPWMIGGTWTCFSLTHCWKIKIPGRERSVFWGYPCCEKDRDVCRDSAKLKNKLQKLIVKFWKVTEHKYLGTNAIYCCFASVHHSNWIWIKASKMWLKWELPALIWEACYKITTLTI